jgi:hypothetical protein
MRKKSFFYLLIITLLAIQCRKPDFQLITKTEMLSIEAAGPTSVKITATVVDLSAADHNGAGVCFSDKDQFPTVDADSKFELKAAGKGETSVYLLPGLLGNTVYFVRFYVLDDGQAVYSEPMQVKTLPYPNAVTTLKPSTQISYTTATLHGTVNTLGMPSTLFFEFGQSKDNFQSIASSPKTAEGNSSV